MKRYIFLFIGLLMTVSTTRATTPGVQDKFSEKVNLALRQVGHQLLQIAGDDHSAIPPVEVFDHGEFSLEIGQAFNYDTLPYLLARALRDFEIDENYQVSIRDCFDDNVVLGYNKVSFEQGIQACKGRELWSECNNIILTIDTPPTPVEGSSFPIFSMVLLLFTAAGLGIYLQRSRQKEETSSDESTITLGQFDYDPKNQTLGLNDEEKTLTFRENKLLHFLVQHSNEVITRDTLIEAVWGDEGVIVGRSLDVFISRLRKLLKPDDSVQIKTIHGVGYRLEVG